MAPSMTVQAPSMIQSYTVAPSMTVQAPSMTVQAMVQNPPMTVQAPSMIQSNPMVQSYMTVQAPPMTVQAPSKTVQAMVQSPPMTVQAPPMIQMKKEEGSTQPNTIVQPSSEAKLQIATHPMSVSQLNSATQPSSAIELSSMPNVINPPPPIRTTVSQDTNFAASLLPTATTAPSHSAMPAAST